MTMTLQDELKALATELRRAAATTYGPAVAEVIERLQAVVMGKFEKSCSKSWWGYQSRIYYRNFEEPPPGARFSIEWGTTNAFSNPTCGEWIEYDDTEVTQTVLAEAGNPDLAAVEHSTKELRDLLPHSKSELISIL